jgi:hypothetical protein
LAQAGLPEQDYLTGASFVDHKLFYPTTERMNPRIVLLCGIYALPVIGGGIAVFGWLHLRTFLNSHPSISSERDFDELKRVVKTNMYLALCLITIVVLMVILGGIGIWSGFVKWWELIGLLIIGPICSVGGVLVTAVEKQVKRIPLEDESLREDFDHVVQRWTSSALPDW